MGGIEDGLKKAWNFEDGAIVHCGGIGAKGQEIGGAEKGSGGSRYASEIRNDQTHAFFPNPTSIETFLGERAGVALDNDRQAHGEGFTDAAGPGFADKEIGEMHEGGNLTCEFLDGNREAKTPLAEARGEEPIFSAHEDQLKIEGAIVEPLGDFEDGLGALSAEENDAGGEMGMEAEATALEFAGIGEGLIEARVEDHAGGEKDGGRLNAEFPGLGDGVFGAADEILGLAFEPEVGREIGEIGEKGDEGSLGRDVAQALKEGAIEVRDDGENEVGTALFPDGFEQAHGFIVVETKEGLEDAHDVRASPGPAIFEHEVVNILDANAGKTAGDIQLIQ